jgi:hypothetical protein
MKDQNYGKVVTVPKEYVDRTGSARTENGGKDDNT